MQESCNRVLALLPPDEGKKGGIGDIAKGAIEPVVKALSEGVAALYNNYRNDKALIRQTIQTQLEAAKWPDFGEVKAAQWRFAALLVLGFLRVPAEAEEDLYYSRPVLTVDPGMHTAAIRAVSTDAAGRFAVTGSYDKTVQIRLLPTGRFCGRYQYRSDRAISAGSHGGDDPRMALPWPLAVVPGTPRNRDQPIYLFDRNSGDMIARIGGVEEVAHRLVFSPDGPSVVAGLGGTEGVRVFDRDKNSSEFSAIRNMGEDASGVAFAGMAGSRRHILTAKSDFTTKPQAIVPPVSVPSGKHPMGVAFSPDGRVLAVGYGDVAAIDLFDSRDLSRLPGRTSQGCQRAICSGWRGHWTDRRFMRAVFIRL